MAKTPVLVTVAEWKKAKAATLKDPGLDKKLADWEKAKNQLDKSPSIAEFKKCAAALKDVVATAKTTQDKCNKTLHKDTITFLGGYPAAAAKIANGLQKQGEDYSKRVAAWNKKRVDCLAGMKKLDPAGEQLLSKFEAVKKTCDASKGTADAKRGVSLADQALKEIMKFKETAKDTMDIVRIATVGPSIDVSDRDQKYVDMFTQAINIQSSLEGGFNGPIAYLEKYVKENK
jgi:hypothetical protein